jgi:hypothetical protein
MKIFFKRLILFSLPLLLYVILVVIVDPYNVLRGNYWAVFSESKHKISYRLNYPLFKLQQFKRNPTDIILLGDSRTDSLAVSNIEDLVKIKISNLAYGGGDLPEIIDTFWYVASIYPIKKVFIGINFNLYNSFNSLNRVSEAKKILKSPINYIFCKYTFKSTFFILAENIFKIKFDIGKPKLSKKEFWDHQLGKVTDSFYRNYSYPKIYNDSLKNIGKFCDEQKIDLIFFIPPTHVDLQKKVYYYNLGNDYRKFKDDLSKIAKVYDFDNPNEITSDENNFTDPYHFNTQIASVVIKKIFKCE